MGPGFVIFLWLILAGIYGSIVVALTGLWWLGKRKNWVWLKWLAGLPAAGTVFLGIMAILFFSHKTTTVENHPADVFQTIFQTAPSNLIHDLKCDRSSFFDFYSVYLRFKTTPDEFHRLIPGGLENTAPDKFVVPSENNVPSWWAMHVNSTCICHLRDERGQEKPCKNGFSRETEYFAYDPQTQTAYYHFIGID